jgi:hypothetical protein
MASGELNPLGKRLEGDPEKPPGNRVEGDPEG